MTGRAHASDPAGSGEPAGSFRFDGRRVRFAPGQTVAAALWADGVRSWRTTRGADRPRGLFCGIGVCFDCLVTLDGRPDLRACLAPARDGLDVRTQRGSGDRG
jgi:predicted molibdopterin-dependent oxidoreductase YjgC